MENNLKKMTTAAAGAVKYIFNPHGIENALILTDTNSLSIAAAFTEALKKNRCNVDKYVIEEKMRPLKEIPEDLEMKLQGKTIVLNIIKSFAGEIPFRIKWISKVKSGGKARMGHMPGITEDMMLNSVNVDFSKMKQTAASLMTRLDGAVQLHVTTKEGTDILIGIKNRIFISDIGVREGEMCNIPCGEIYTAPLETEANGIVVFNASIADIGLLNLPLKAFISDGRISGFESDDEDMVNRINELSDVDTDAKVIGELGIGVNPGARITGSMLEDEKAFNTAHIAFGNNEDFPGGGLNRSKIHRDFLFYRPTIEAQYEDGSKLIIMRDGDIVK